MAYTDFESEEQISEFFSETNASEETFPDLFETTKRKLAVNTFSLRARRAIEDYLEQKRLRQKVGYFDEDLLDQDV
jgi:hypothetical protein